MYPEFKNEETRTAFLKSLESEEIELNSQRKKNRVLFENPRISKIDTLATGLTNNTIYYKMREGRIVDQVWSVS